MVVFTKAFADSDDAVRSLAGFDVLVAMRERTRFPAGVLERLTGLRLLVSTGPANAAIDVAAARKRGITVCGTRYESHPTIEHTWALIRGAARNLYTIFYRDAVEDIAVFQAGSPIRLME